MNIFLKAQNGLFKIDWLHLPTKHCLEQVQKVQKALTVVINDRKML